MLDLDTLIDLTVRAGAIARRHFRRVPPERKEDRTFVTVADREVEEFLRAESRRISPETGFLGEETVPSASVNGYTLVVDPIDGTGSFVDELPTWTVSVGLCRDGEPVRGVVAVPMMDETYATDEGILWRDGTRLEPRVRVPLDEESRFLITSRALRRHGIRFPGKVRSLGSTAYHLALVARGVAIGALLGRPRAWDLAAGTALVRAAGGDVTDLTGRRLSFPELLTGQPPASTLLACGAGYGEDIVRMFREVER
jgi:myo-inositol-1(or 4)-monophosphatase